LSSPRAALASGREKKKNMVSTMSARTLLLALLAGVSRAQFKLDTKGKSPNRHLAVGPTE
jgi:hypothetical protein